LDEGVLVHVGAEGEVPKQIGRFSREADAMEAVPKS
jgi:hypothetical protein